MLPQKGGKKNGEDDKRKKGGKKPDNIKFNNIDMAKLIRDLRGARTNQETVRKEIADLLPQYLGLSAGERDGFLKNKGKVFKKVVRKNAADRSTKLQAQLEDFLFYQDAVNRRLRFDPDRPTAVERDEGQRLNRPPMLISSHGDDPRKVQYLRDMLNYYDRRNIGTALSKYREANIEAGEVDDGRDAQHVLLEPEDLHLITPTWRRAPGGLREEEERLALEQAARDPIQFRVNEEAIEARRAEFENIVDDDADLEYRTHTERRAAELDAYADTRPSTANIFVRTNAEGGQIDEDRFRRIQTASGVFVAARESSHDWLTSYDCLGLVKICGIPEHFETSAVRDEDRFYDSPDEDEDFDAPFDPPSDEMEGGNDGEHEEGVGPANDGASEDLEDDGGDDLPVDGDGEAPQATAMSGEEPDDTGRQLRNGKQLSSSPMPKAKRVKRKTDGAQANTVSKGTGNDAGPAKGSKKKGASKPAPGNGTKGSTEDESRERVTASIDYPYNKREFCLPKKTRWVEDDRLLSTVWAEATDGRRERHVGMIEKPYSPVNSPPRSPIDPDVVDMSTIPDGNGLPNEPKLRRCTHGNTTCRTWTHATDECWSLQEEPTSLPTNRMEIDAPVMLDVPEGSRKTYHGRLHDHYGRRGRGKAIWPRVGIRVPYEPTTLTPAENVKHINAPLQGWRSLAVPIIEEAQHEKIKWNMDPDPTDSGDEYDEGDEGDEGDSDDEDDLFRMSYEQGSFPNGRPAPVIPPTMAPGPTAPDDTATANAATEGVVPAEDDPVDDGAEDL